MKQSLDNYIYIAEGQFGTSQTPFSGQHLLCTLTLPSITKRLRPRMAPAVRKSMFMSKSRFSQVEFISTVVTNPLGVNLLASATGRKVMVQGRVLMVIEASLAAKRTSILSLLPMYRMSHCGCSECKYMLACTVRSSWECVEKLMACETFVRGETRVRL